MMFNFTLVYLKDACHANPGAVGKLAESSSYILKQMFCKFSNTLT